MLFRSAPHLGQVLASEAISAPHARQFFIFFDIPFPPVNQSIISQIGMLKVYQNGIIVSRVIFLRLKELRRAKRITQLKLAMDLNMAQNTISRYESGEREPGISELILIADYFNISIDYLLGRTDNPQINR